MSFFRKCVSFFKSPNLKKKILKITILSCLLLWAGISYFKFRIVIPYYSFLKLENLKKSKQSNSNMYV